MVPISGALLGIGGVAQRDHRAAVGSRRGGFGVAAWQFWGCFLAVFWGCFLAVFWGCFLAVFWLFLGVFFWGVFLGCFLVLGCFLALILRKFFFLSAIQIKGKVGLSPRLKLMGS